MANRKQPSARPAPAPSSSKRASVPSSVEFDKFWEDWEVTSAEDVERDTLPLRREAQIKR